MTDQLSLRSNSEDTSPQSPDSRWRTEITERVAGYRHRRGRRIEGAFSMRFPFPPATAAEADSEAPQEVDGGEEEQSHAADSTAASAVETGPDEMVDSPTEPVSSHEPPPATVLTDPIAEAAVPLISGEIEGPPEREPSSARPSAPRPPAKRKVIAFPRQASLAPEAHHRLADPVVPEQPRILDVPEELEAFPCAPLLDGLHLPSHAAGVTPPADHVELPFAAVRISQRVLAGILDCAVVAVSAAMFGAVAYKMLPRMTLTKPLLLIAAAMPILFWTAYQYLLTMYGGATIGMRMLHLRLSTFKGGAPNWRYRRSRVLGLYFSAASLAMGLLWALVDVDGLCWHDRISRTYLIKRD